MRRYSKNYLRYPYCSNLATIMSLLGSKMSGVSFKDRGKVTQSPELYSILRVIQQTLIVFSFYNHFFRILLYAMQIDLYSVIRNSFLPAIQKF